MIGIQYLRAIAAVMVVVYHLQPQFGRMAYDGPWATGLASGVDIFFVISGLIMWVTTSNRRIAPIDFWRRRIVRIVPLYWVFTTLIVVVMLVMPHLLQTGRFDAYHVAMSYLFLPAEHPVTGMMEPVVIPGWTLNYEMFFYLVFGLFLFASTRVRFFAPAAILIALAAIGASGHVTPQSVLGFYTASIVLEFLFGMIVGVMIVRGDMLARIPFAVAMALAIGGVLLLLLPLHDVFRAAPRVLLSGVPSLALVVGVVSMEVRGRLAHWPWLVRLGDASYSLYLSHAMVLSVVSQLWRKLDLNALPGGVWMFAIVGIAASIAAGLAVYNWIETPLVRLMVTRSGERRRPSS